LIGSELVLRRTIISSEAAFGGQEQRVAIARAIVSDPTCSATSLTGDPTVIRPTEILDIGTAERGFKKTIVMVRRPSGVYAHVSRHLEKGVCCRPASFRVG